MKCRMTLQNKSVLLLYFQQIMDIYNASSKSRQNPVSIVSLQTFQLVSKKNFSKDRIAVNFRGENIIEDLAQLESF